MPEGLVPSDIVSRMAKKGIVVTGGIHKEHKGECLLGFCVGSAVLNELCGTDKYFRIG